MGKTRPLDIERMAYLSDEAFIHHCFVRAFRRVCNPSRARHYLAALANGTSRSEVAQSISQEDKCNYYINTAELKKLTFLDGELFLHAAYKKILGRSIDNSGLQHYLQRLSKGEEKLRILHDLVTSPEGQARGSLDTKQIDFVKLLTKEYAPQCPIGLKDLVRLMAVKDEELVQEAYKVVLRREADTAGLFTYQQALRNGLPKIRFLRSLAYSQEGKEIQKTIGGRLYLMRGRFF